MDKQFYDNCVVLLKNDLVPALGCTEPIAIAYCAAKAAAVLSVPVEKIDIYCSGNIIKNVKSVTVPNSNGLKGIEAAAVLGAIGGNADEQLEVLRDITDEDRKQAEKLLEQNICSVHLQHGAENLYIRCLLTGRDNNVASVELKTTHTHISRIELNGNVLFSDDEKAQKQSGGNASALSLTGIYEFAKNCALEDIQEPLMRQASANMALCKAGLEGNWGVNVGKTYLQGTENIRQHAAALAAACSDARMSGCPLPAIINSGSGNQGCTVSLPILAYAKAFRIDVDTTLRALALANLIRI